MEVMEASYSLDQTRRSGYDPDELEEEQRERAMRARMNQEFQNFVKKIEEQAAHRASNPSPVMLPSPSPPPSPSPTPHSPPNLHPHPHPNPNPIPKPPHPHPNP